MVWILVLANSARNGQSHGPCTVWLCSLFWSITILHQGLPEVEYPTGNSLWPAAIGVALWYAAASASISLFRVAAWRHHAAFWFIASAIAILCLDRVILPTSRTELDAYYGFIVGVDIQPRDTASLRKVELNLTLNDQYDLEGRLSLEGTSNRGGLITVYFPSDTVVIFPTPEPGKAATATTALSLPGTLTLSDENYFNESFVFSCHCDTSRPLGIGRSLYRLGLDFNRSHVGFGAASGQLIVRLPNESRHFGDSFPAPTSAPEYQAQAWALDKYGNVEIEVETMGALERFLVDQASSILLIGFGFFLGSLSVSRLRPRGDGLGE
jgi:hypothetical protein